MPFGHKLRLRGKEKMKQHKSPHGLLAIICHSRAANTHGQISLNEDVTNWESAIIAAWHDHVVPGAPITFQIVDPPPPHLEPGIAAHILVVQYPHEHLASSLVTIYDRDWHPEDGPYTRMAITTMAPIQFSHVVHQTGYNDICLHPVTPRLCAVWWGNIQITVQHPIPGRNGCGLVFQVAHAAGQTRERLTDGQVAHTHRPRKPLQPLVLSELLEAPMFISIDFSKCTRSLSSVASIGPWTHSFLKSGCEVASCNTSSLCSHS